MSVQRTFVRLTDAKVTTSTEVHTPNFFHWKKYPFITPAELNSGAMAPCEVAIAGAGPVGLTTALSLAQQGIRVVVFEARDQVSDSSRTLAVSRRSAQILDRLGVGDAFKQRAVTRKHNYLYFGDQLVSHSAYEQAPTEKFPDISVLQQPWTEHILLQEVLVHPNIDLRWLSAVEKVQDKPESVELFISTPEGSYTFCAPYLVACDGARGQVRRSLGLSYEEIGDGVLARNFIICDFEMKTEHPIARRLWVRPPFRPNSAVILHKQPFDTWRLDYALEDDEDPQEALKPENVAKVVQAQVDLLLGKNTTTDWKIVWISSYRPMSRSLASYRHGQKIFFAGDAAHQTPIFGGRGMNQGMLDASNLSWRLAAVIKGKAPAHLLDGYDAERRPVIVRNLHAISQATLCMTAPSRGANLLRKAVFDLMPTEAFTRPLIDAFNANKAESLLTPPPAEDPASSAQVGSPLPDARITSTEGQIKFLYDQLAVHGFTVIACYAEDDSLTVRAKAWFEQQGMNCRYVAISPIADLEACQKLGVSEGDWILVRPDGYVAARMVSPNLTDMQNAWSQAMGHVETLTTP